MFKRILLAYDGSESGRRALLECSDVAHLTHAEVKLLAVTPAVPPLYVGEGYIPTDTLDMEKDRFTKVLEEGITTMRERGFACEGQLTMGEPVDEIARVGKEWGAELIVLGHRKAASWAERWWRGSVTRSLIEIAPCSLLVVITRSPM